MADDARCDLPYAYRLTLFIGASDALLCAMVPATYSKLLITRASTNDNDTILTWKEEQLSIQWA